MNENVTLPQLAAELARLRQHFEQMNQRLDMIYGAVTRLAEAKTDAAGPLTRPTASSAADMAFPAQALLDPGSMLASLHQHALKVGLTLPTGSEGPSEK